MARNNAILDAYSILYSWAEDQAENMDVQLVNADDGEESTAENARSVFIDELNGMISSLEKLRLEVKTKPWKQFTAKHL